MMMNMVELKMMVEMMRMMMRMMIRKRTVAEKDIIELHLPA